jgi:hypothetical protein
MQKVTQRNRRRFISDNLQYCSLLLRLVFLQNKIQNKIKEENLRFMLKFRHGWVSSSSSRFSDGQTCLNNEYCHLVELLQVTKQVVAPGLRFHLARFPLSAFGCKVRASFEDIVNCHWLCVAAAHVTFTNSKLMVQIDDIGVCSRQCRVRLWSLALLVRQIIPDLFLHLVLKADGWGWESNYLFTRSYYMVLYLYRIA